MSNAFIVFDHFQLTVPGNVQFHQVLKVLDVCGQLVDFIVAEAQLAKSVQPEEALWRLEYVKGEPYEITLCKTIGHKSHT